MYIDKGTLIIDDKGWRIEDGGGKAPRGTARGEGQSGHVQNFLDCVKNRSSPSADIRTGHPRTRLCHPGYIASRLGRKLGLDGPGETFHDPEAKKLLTREYGTRLEMPLQV